jgi:hypothetical protein
MYTYLFFRHKLLHEEVEENSPRYHMVLLDLCLTSVSISWEASAIKYSSTKRNTQPETLKLLIKYCVILLRCFTVFVLLTLIHTTVFR